jgi:hypothetical protein
LLAHAVLPVALRVQDNDGKRFIHKVVLELIRVNVLISELLKEELSRSNVPAEIAQIPRLIGGNGAKPTDDTPTRANAAGSAGFPALVA